MSKDYGMRAAVRARNTRRAALLAKDKFHSAVHGYIEQGYCDQISDRGAKDKYSAWCDKHQYPMVAVEFKGPGKEAKILVRLAEKARFTMLGRTRIAAAIATHAGVENIIFKERKLLLRVSSQVAIHVVRNLCRLVYDPVMVSGLPSTLSGGDQCRT